VSGPFSKRRAFLAVQSLCKQLVSRVDDYHEAKVRLLAARITAEKQQLASLQTSTKQAQAALARIQASSLPSVDKTIGSGNWVAVLQTLSSQVTTLTTSLGDDQLELAASRDVEAPGFLSPPAASRQAPATRRTSFLVAALIGLIVGIGLALAWDALLSPRGEDAAPARG
jgi:hypothetical protein